MTMQIRAAPPIAPPTMAPMLLGVVGGVAAVSDDVVDGESPDTSFVGADIPAPVGGGEVIWSEDDEEGEPEESEEGVEGGLEDESGGVVEVVGGIVVDFLAGVGVGVGVGVFVNDVGDASK